MVERLLFLRAGAGVGAGADHSSATLVWTWISYPTHGLHVLRNTPFRKEITPGQALLIEYELFYSFLNKVTTSINSNSTHQRVTHVLCTQVLPITVYTLYSSSTLCPHVHLIQTSFGAKSGADKKHNSRYRSCYLYILLKDKWLQLVEIRIKSEKMLVLKVINDQHLFKRWPHKIRNKAVVRMCQSWALMTIFATTPQCWDKTKWGGHNIAACGVFAICWITVEFSLSRRILSLIWDNRQTNWELKLLYCPHPPPNACIWPVVQSVLVPSPCGQVHVWGGLGGGRE